MTTIDLHFNDALGHLHTVHALTTDGHGWHLHATLEGRVFSRRCGSWQGVERALCWLRQHAHDPAAQPPARPHAPVPVWSVLAALLLSVCASSAWAQPSPAADPVAAFTAATRDYAQLHRRIEQQLGPIQITDRPETLRHAIEAMAAAIRAERRDAKQGDLFTPALGRELRVRIDQALRAHGFTAADVLVEGVEGPDPADFALRVNGPFPWVLSQAMFPCVTGALPPLPPELQYRIVDTGLVLIDVHASLIVDLLPNALADLTLRNDRPDE